MSRVVGRDGLRAGDIRSYQSDFLGMVPAAIAAPDDAAECRAFEFESLDVIKLAPLLLLMAAQEKAREMISQAEASAAQIRQRTLDDNMAQGREDAKRELLPSLVAFADAGQSLIIFEEQLVARYTPHIVELALEIAEKVIAKAVTEDPEIITSVLQRAKHEIVDAKQIRIWLNPTDYKLLAELRPDLIQTGDEAGRTIEVAASDAIVRGGCRLETESGLVDATVPTQIEEIRRQLLDEDVFAGRDNGAPIALAKT